MLTYVYLCFISRQHILLLDKTQEHSPNIDALIQYIRYVGGQDNDLLTALAAEVKLQELIARFTRHLMTIPKKDNLLHIRQSHQLHEYIQWFICAAVITHPHNVNNISIDRFSLLY
jgi:hypothetical protein